MLSADVVYSLGRDLNMRPRVNQRIPGSLSNPRIISNAIGTALNPNSNANRPATSNGKSEYEALIIGLRRRMSKGVDFTARLYVGTGAQQHRRRRRSAEHREHPGPEQPVRRAGAVRSEPPTPTRGTGSTCRRRSSCLAISAISPIFLWRSALPVALHRWTRSEPRRRCDGNSDERLRGRLVRCDTGVSTFKDIGACETVNCGRGMAQ